jgi:general secretion pathway protein B
MSSILKALKKLEEDKAAHRPGELKLDAEIVRTANSPRFFSTGALVTSLLMLAGGSGATYMYMKREKPPVISTQQRPPGPAASETKTEQLPAAVVVVPAENQKKPAHSEAPKLLHQPLIPGRTATTISAPRPAPAKPVVASKPADPAKPSKAPLPPVSESVKDVPSLRVNGIAFQNIAADSMAIVNGTPVSNGSIIEGITVEEIRKDRVLFQRNGEKFEILLGQSNR